MGAISLPTFVSNWSRVAEHKSTRAVSKDARLEEKGASGEAGLRPMAEVRYLGNGRKEQLLKRVEQGQSGAGGGLRC